jgi:hypothetical protein
MAMWSIAILLLRLRPPRPALSDLSRQPGTVACLAATIVFAIRLMNIGLALGVLALDGTFGGMSVLQQIEWIDAFRGTASEIGCAVSVAWIVQAISGRWDCERSWVDRLGRFNGTFWIGTIPFASFSFVVSG